MKMIKSSTRSHLTTVNLQASLSALLGRKKRSLDECAPPDTPSPARKRHQKVLEDYGYHREAPIVHVKTARQGLYAAMSSHGTSEIVNLKAAKESPIGEMSSQMDSLCCLSLESGVGASSRANHSHICVHPFLKNFELSLVSTNFFNNHFIFCCNMLPDLLSYLSLLQLKSLCAMADVITVLAIAIELLSPQSLKGLVSATFHILF
jgi:hypothetical protein